MSFAPSRHLRHLLCAVTAFMSLAAMPQAAAAAATASVSISNIRLSVVDLDLNDGVTAGVSFLDGMSSVFGSFRVVKFGPISEGGGIRDEIVDLPGLDNPFISASESLSFGGAQVSGATTPSSLAVSGSAAPATSISGSFVLEAGSNRPGGEPWGLQLTSGTRLVVEADYSSLAVVNPADACNGGCGNMQTRAVIALTAEFTHDAGAPNNDLDAVDLVAVSQSGRERAEQSGSLHVEFDNFVEDNNVQLLLGASIQGQAGVAPIPEPETYALMLLGLAALGGMSMRRRLK